MGKSKKTNPSTNGRKDGKQNTPRKRRTVTERKQAIAEHAEKMRAAFERKMAAMEAQSVSLDYLEQFKDAKAALTSAQYADCREILVSLLDHLPHDNVEVETVTPAELSEVVSETI